MTGLHPINQATLVACVEEFYTTSDDVRRKELDQQLTQFKLSFPCADTIAACISMMDRTNSTNVQFFGALSLYDTVRHRSEDCISTPNLMETLKGFLISNLAASAHGQLQSVTQKLSSTLALLALYSIPDVWAEPVQDLCSIWSAVPELLLRVLAELAAEFANVRMPLTQRSILKTKLHRMSEEIIIIIRTVMASSEMTPSTCHAAVECVEQWVQLPGIGLQQWTEVLSVVFAAVTEDNAALTNLLNILASNEELGSLEQLVLDICRYITQVAAQKIASELQADSESDEAVSLVAAVCSLAEKAVPILIRHVRMHEGSTYLTDLCRMFATLSSWNGHYPVDESISDLPSVFWTTLREDLIQSKTSYPTQPVIESVRGLYGAVCQSAVEKLAYPPDAVWTKWDKEQREKFKNYRQNRSEVSLDAFYMVGSETLNFLNRELDAAITAGNVNRTESVLYLWHLVADYLTEEQYQQICSCLELCTKLYDVPAGREGDRLGCTLMQLFVAMAHLVEAHDNALRLQTFVVRMILAFMHRPRCAREVLHALDKVIGGRNSSLYQEVGQEVSEKCYTFFMDERNSTKTRLMALKCIGFVLSVKETSEVMDIVNRMISPHVSDLSGKQVVSEEELARRLFQIEIFSSLFSTIQDRNRVNVAVNDCPLALILEQAMPVFRAILSSQGEQRSIGDKICEAMLSAACGLPESVVCDVFPFFMEIIDLSLVSNASASCALAKAVVLTFNKTQAAGRLCDAAARWFSVFEQNPSFKDVDEWLSLVYAVVKKDWKMLRANGSSALAAITSAIKLGGYSLMNSSEPGVVRSASQVLATIASQATSFDDEAPRKILAEHGSELVQAIFQRIQKELMRPTVESLAEVMFFFAKHFPAETRVVIRADERGDSPMVAAMLHEVGNLRNFKQMTLRFNQACRKA